MDVLQSIDRRFRELRDSGKLDAWLSTVAQQPLAAVSDIGQLKRLCHGPGPAPRPERDRLIAALCDAASRTPRDETAGLVLCWLFLPGLKAAFVSVPVSDWADREEISASLMVGFFDAASRIELSSSYVARRLLKGARQAALVSVMNTESAWENAVPLFEEIPGGERPDDYDDTLVSAEQRGVVSADDARMLLADHGEVEDIALDQGMSAGAAWQRRRRARLRLKSWLSESFREYGNR